METQCRETGSGKTAGASAQWYLWEGGFLAVGRSDAGVIPAHGHHAIQIFLAISGNAAIKSARGDWRQARGIIVPPDVVHSFDSLGSPGAMLFVDPESSEGVWLRSMIRQQITLIPEVRIEPCVTELRKLLDQPFEAMETGALIRHCVQHVCAGAPPARRLDQRITTVLKAIRESEELKMSLEAAADIACLSPSRFQHLFKQQVGLPFRRYLLWRKLTRAMVAFGREGTIAAAAHAADFSDAAHLTRTFYQMFGIPPSVMLRGEFFEIASPFVP